MTPSHSFPIKLTIPSIQRSMQTLSFPIISLLAYMGKKAANFRLSTAKRTDIRVRFMNEIIQGIQVIKMYAWEKSFASVIDKVRR